MTSTTNKSEGMFIKVIKSAFRNVMFAVFFFFCASGSAFAQYVIGGIRYTCPVGTSWNDPRCIREADTAAQIAPSQPRWATRWGAIYVDSSKGKISTAAGMSSARKAQEGALEKCRLDGGEACEESLTYYNQCGVFAWGESYAVSQGAETLKLASEIALEKCSRHTTDCQIYYSGCSFAENVN